MESILKEREMKIAEEVELDTVMPAGSDTNTDAKQNMEIPVQSTAYLLLKRGFDVFSSFCVSMIILIPLAILALMVSIKDPACPFYIQKRVGQQGKTFGLVKLRSMRKGADKLENMLTPEQLEQYKKEFKLEDDPRLIGYHKPGDGKKCFGAFLRRTSLDELPQIIWNICIKGNMSVVGPRPILEEELQNHYTPEEQKLLLSVKPGLTGYWQAYARNNVGYENHRRQDMELYYVQHASFTLDLKILWQTFFTVIRKSGAK